MSSKSIFYSWQSDTPARENRNFIEQALKGALKRLKSDAELTDAIRAAELMLDKDTSGIPGSPPIAETILRKIEECSVFVADLTYIGESLAGFKKDDKPKRLISNPNVLIEYGYALRTHSYLGVIGVINTAYGYDHMNQLPFDLRHLRWPITYSLKDKSDPDAKKILDELTISFAERLKSVLLKPSISDPKVDLFIPFVSAEEDPAVFSTSDEDLIPERSFGSESLYFDIPDEGRTFIRIHPKFKVPAFRSAVEAKDKASKGGLRPMGERVNAWDTNRNARGAIVHASLRDGCLYNFTQLFLSGEIWGVDASAVNATECTRFTNGRSNGFLASSFVESNFAYSVHNYLQFYKGVWPEVREFVVQIGMTGILGYPIAVKGCGMVGRALNQNILWTGDFDIQQPIDTLLNPFFEMVWEECGLSRTESAKDMLADYIRQLVA